MAGKLIMVDGPVNVYVAGPANGTLLDLGYTENGVEVHEQPYFYDVHGDENGGDSGPPIDTQYMGEVHVIRMTLTKFNPVTARAIKVRVAGSTPGTPATPGTVMFQAGKEYRLVLDCFDGRNYTRVVFREPIEINKGTKHSKLLIVGTAYKDATGVIYNTTGVTLQTTTTTTTAAP